ncbi:MAG: hypothetical protein OHK0029_05410 [Armatimonadaceae bacterium]
MKSPDSFPDYRAILWFMLLLLLLGGIQATASSALRIAGGQPDFVLSLALTSALLSNASMGTLSGLCAGLVTASLVGQTVGTIMASRVIAGFVAGCFTVRLYGSNIGVLLLGVFTGSVVAELVSGIAAPRLTVMHWVQSALVGSAMNAVLALPLSFVLRRCGWQPTKPRTFP